MFEPTSHRRQSASGTIELTSCSRASSGPDIVLLAILTGALCAALGEQLEFIGWLACEEDAVAVLRVGVDLGI
jgi:hypothetical protein